jgi:hypothetical protein
MTLKEAFGKGQQPQRDFRDLAVLQPPLVYPVAADRLGLVRRPRGRRDRILRDHRTRQFLRNGDEQ